MVKNTVRKLTHKNPKKHPTSKPVAGTKDQMVRVSVSGNKDGVHVKYLPAVCPKGEWQS